MGSKEAGTRTAAAMLLALAAAAPGGRAEAAGLPAARVVSLRFEPPSLTFLHRRDARHFLVIAVTPDGQTLDVTEKAAVRPLQGLVRMGEGGYLEPLKAGRGAMAVTAAGITARLPVTVRSLAAPSVSFVRDVMPALSKTGCNAGTCHGAARGRNGFRLSLRGYDPDWDYHALVDEVFGRRVNKAVPDQSLALLKPVQAVPHQGGLVFEPSSRFYRVIRQWIAEGLSSDVGSTARVSRLEVLPASPTLRLPGEKQNLVVVAHYPDGSTRDVTREAIYTSSVPEVAEVSDGAQVTAVRRGEAAMLVRYEGQYATGEVTVLGDRRGWKWLATPQHNQIDGLVDAKLRRIKSSPTPLAADADFLRRVYIDLTGLPPTSDAARAFLADPRPGREKRNALIEQLLASPEFDDHWTYKLADLLQVNRKFLGEKGVQAFRAWIHDAVARNMPYDQFVREILTATGSSYENPAANYFRVVREPATATESVTQLFLGVRFACNKCHDHPFERWTWSQYYALGAYFAQVGYKAGTPGEEMVFDRNQGEIRHPKDGRVMAPAFPVAYEGQAAAGPTRRQALADWLTSPRNPFFAKSTVNRFWSYFLGRGIIDPVDDIRNGNPPSNRELLDWLTQDFVRHRFDLRHLIRTVVQSRVYQAGIGTNRWNADDRINFSHQQARRLPAEQLIDAVSMATGSRQRYPGVPPGTWAQQLPDTQVALGGFLDLFGRPARESPCECERTSEVSLAQALNLMNGETIAEAIQDPEGRAAVLVFSTPDNRKVTEEIFLATLSRLPTKPEMETALKHFAASSDRLSAAQDLLWSRVNSPAFLFNR